MTSKITVGLLLSTSLGTSLFVQGDLTSTQPRPESLSWPAEDAWAALRIPPTETAPIRSTSAEPRPSTAVEPADVSLSALAQAAQAPPATSPPQTSPQAEPNAIAPAPPIADRDEPARAFAAEVVRLSGEADAVDLVWSAYKSNCQVAVGRAYDYGREWFAVWDQAVDARASSAECAQLMQRLLETGERVRRGLASAREAASRANLPPETVHGMLRWHGLAW
jgi:hypothetical protein